MIRAAASAVVVVCLIASGPLAQSPASSELDEILRRADARRQEYVDVYKNVTAVETTVTELFDKNGKVERQRRIVSDFFVYQSAFGVDVRREYRIPREVDGRPVGKPLDAVTLLQKLTRAKTLAEELRHLKDQNVKYMLPYARFARTLQPFVVIRKDVPHPGLELAIDGRERLDDRDVVVIAYRSKELVPAPAVGPMRHFNQPRMGMRGRAWLDAEDGRLRRWEHESIAADADIATPSAVWRDELGYEASTLGILLPKRIVTTFFEKHREKKKPPVLRLAARATSTFEAFKSFEVATATDVQLPNQKKR